MIPLVLVAASLALVQPYSLPQMEEFGMDMARMGRESIQRICSWVCNNDQIGFDDSVSQIMEEFEMRSGFFCSLCKKKTTTVTPSPTTSSSTSPTTSSPASTNTLGPSSSTNTLGPSSSTNRIVL